MKTYRNFTGIEHGKIPEQQKQEKPQEMITGIQLKQIAPTLKQLRADELAMLINELAPKYAINTKVRLASFLAQVMHESGNFEKRDENLNYSASRLMVVWPNRFPNIAVAKEYERNPQKLANYVYGGRMGNTEPNDGYFFRGAGDIMITGRDMHTKYANFIGKPVNEVPELLRTTDRYALDSAMWVFAIDKKLLDEADAGKQIAIRRAINGGTIGLNETQAIYSKAIQVLG